MNRPNKNEVVRNSLLVPKGAATTYLLALVAWALFQPSLPAAEGQP
jgi:hypothetical protein